MSPGWLSRFGRVMGLLPQHLALGAGYILVGVSLATAWSVLMRYGLRHPYSWTYEIGGYAFLIVCATGVGYALQQGRHIGVDLLVDRLRPRARSIAALFSLAATLFWAGLVFWGTLSRALFSLKSGKVSTALLIPVFPIELLVPAGMAIFIVIGFVLLGRGVGRLRSKPPDGPAGEEKRVGGPS